VVAHGGEVLAYLKAASPASLPCCVLLDLKMPEMSGLEVLAWLRNEPRFATLPTIIFSSSTEKTDLDFCRRHHANAFLAKPANAENLSPLVRQILEALTEARRKTPMDTLL
ncbi:MAG TPA: response regulator, partial [Opitutaceae bacterium]|nr:response regulator [Opitutaceae bacterium]